MTRCEFLNARLPAWRDCVANRASVFTRSLKNEERPALRLASCFHRRPCGGTFAGSALLVACACPFRKTGNRFCGTCVQRLLRAGVDPGRRALLDLADLHDLAVRLVRLD